MRPEDWKIVCPQKLVSSEFGRLLARKDRTRDPRRQKCQRQEPRQFCNVDATFGRQVRECYARAIGQATQEKMSSAHNVDENTVGLALRSVALDYNTRFDAAAANAHRHFDFQLGGL
jgi:hypothetical protein